MKQFPVEILSGRTDVMRAKHIYGIWYGAALGLAFSLFAWGIDAYALNLIHGLYPWLKFLGGAIPCMIVGALTGWLSARLDKPVFALLLWAVASAIFAWLIVQLPLQITPRVLSLVEPEIGDLLHYEYFEAFASRLGIAYVWIVIFVSVAGLLQIPLSDTAVFSTSPFGKLAPVLVTLALMGICGTIVDGLNNELLRSPIDAVNTTVEYYLDHRGEEIDAAESRRMRLGALRQVAPLVTPQRQFIVSGYDQYLERVQVLARFEDAWVECDLVVNQLLSCRQVGNNP